MTKKEMVKAILKDCEALPRDRERGLEMALKYNKRPYIEKVYRFYREQPGMAGMCMNLLSGMVFDTKQKEKGEFDEVFAV